MKKIFYGIGILMGSLLLSTPLFAKSLETGICAAKFEVPDSCWKEVGTSVQKKIDAAGCNFSTGNLSDKELDKFISEVESFQSFLGKRKTEDETLIKIQEWTKPTGDAKSKMESIQNLLEKYYGKSGTTFAKGNITCTFHIHGKDQKYGLCTRDAMEQFTKHLQENCIEPSLTEIPSTRCRIQINFVSSNMFFSKAKLQKKIERDAAEKIAKGKTPPEVIKEQDYYTELEKELTAKLGQATTLTWAGGDKFYFEVAGQEASDFEKKTEDILKDKTFLAKTEKLDDETSHPYSDFVENISVTKEQCAIDVLENRDIGGLRPRYLVGASDGTRNLSGSVHDITYWFQRFGRKIVGFIAAVAVFFIVWNAFGMVMSMGDADKISSSKKAIQWIVIGLALSIFAYVIIKTIISLTYLSAV